MTVRRRLLLVLVTTALIGAALVSAGAIWLMRSAVRENFVSRIAAETRLLATQATALDAVEAQPFAAVTARDLGIRVTLIDAEGVVLGDSSKDSAGVARMDNHLGRPEVEQARLAGAGTSFRVSDTTQVEYLYSARRLEGDWPVEYIRVALPSSEVDHVQSIYTAWIVGVALLSALILSAAAVGMVRHVSRPIESMTHAVEQAARGGAAVSLPHGALEEVTRLGTAVRRMQQVLLEKIAELDAEGRVLGSIVSGMHEGLLLVAPDQRVRLANDAFRKTFDIQFDPAGHLLAEVIRDPRVLGSVQAVLDSGQAARRPVLRVDPGLAFELRVTPVGPPGGLSEGALVLLFDISRMERLENVRREFVANVSHELRTPLTSIKAFVETLLDGGLDDRENARKFLEIIDRHADRMKALVEDLTKLSLIETGAIELETREFNAGEVLRELIDQFEPVARTAGIEIRVEPSPDLRLCADRRRFEQMLANLLDNALKYSGESSTVTLSASRVDGRPVIRVADTGVGIAQESQDKIFHRFYQVDKARSREIGGTGLGLAIVKHLMRLHGGNVRVESNLGEGSAFYLEFPRVES